MTAYRFVTGAVRLVVAVAIVAATVVTLSSSISSWADAGYRDLATLYVNFFSYFTIESNLAAAVVLAVGAVLVVTRRTADPASYTVIRAAVVVYMGVTGIVYNLLLRGLAVTGGGDTPSWTNEVMHVIAPAYLLLDWVFAPGRTPVRWRHVGTILAFPLLWVAYTLIRGPLVFDQIKNMATWYPYPFLNPARSEHGYASVAIWVVIIAAVFAALAVVVVAVSHWRSRSRSRPRPRPEEVAAPHGEKYAENPRDGG
ncbi:Pr6Pr family membrane protein [Leifsonia sp. NPDC058194]|uniref:Pr6Pr family membrane protein n=1 Tax=Leifsonia sp. NPDC058194 TaxID=3346374 RepID=UPI0036DA73A1